MITLLPDDIHNIAIALTVVILATIVLTTALNYLAIYRPALRRAWKNEAHAQAEATQARQQLAVLRWQVRDATEQLRRLGPTRTGEDAARFLRDQLGPLLGDPEQHLADDARARQP